MSYKDTVRAAIDGIYNQADPRVIDQLFSPAFRQHGVLAADGQEGLRTFISSLSPAASCTVHRVLADNDLVASHATYENLGPVSQVGFELWRLDEGLIVEHWDGFEPVVSETESGHSQVDGPTAPGPADTAATKTLVNDVVQTILVDNDFSRLPDLLAGEDYIQHNPRFADGVSGLGAALAALAEQGITMRYSARHYTVAEGDLALTLSEGRFGDEPYTFYDLFRVVCGRAIEHWDVMTPEATDLKHGNGLY